MRNIFCNKRYVFYPFFIYVAKSETLIKKLRKIIFFHSVLPLNQFQSDKKNIYVLRSQRTWGKSGPSADVLNDAESKFKMIYYQKRQIKPIAMKLLKEKFLFIPWSNYEFKILCYAIFSQNLISYQDKFANYYKIFFSPNFDSVWVWKSSVESRSDFKIVLIR